MILPISYKAYGKKAILIEWQPKIDSEILKSIITFKAKIENHQKALIQDIIIGYHSLTINYKEEISNLNNQIINLKEIYKFNSQTKESKHHLWEIPVCYDTEFGIDLLELSAQKNCSVKKIISLHSEVIYTVYFIGFLPGFLYLGGLDQQLHTSRKANPRLHVAKGAVAIGGKQTGIYPINSAGGWNIIGKTPVSFFNIQQEQPCFATSGDQIKFVAISKQEFYNIEEEVKNGSYSLVKKQLYD